MKIKIEKCQRDFLLSGRVVTTGKDKWIHFPFWLKETSEIDVYEMVNFEKLPEGLKKYIENIKK